MAATGLKHDMAGNSVNEIRSAFLEFFAKNGHEVVPSSPLVPPPRLAGR
jgi:alanyl-tRNA synthetase